MVAITSIKSRFLPLKSKKEKLKAAREQEIICPNVISPATKNELRTNLIRGTFASASLKLSQVG